MEFNKLPKGYTGQLMTADMMNDIINAVNSLMKNALVGKIVRCLHCGSHISNVHENCPNCGATRFVAEALDKS